MKKSMTNKLKLLIPCICGVIIANLFLRLYGITSAYLVDAKVISWVNYMPKYLRSFSFWAHNFFFETLVFSILSIIICGIVGFYLKINYKLATIITFIFFLFTKSLYIYYVLGDFSLVYSPIIYFVLISITSFFILWYCFHIGGKFKQRWR